MDHEFARANGLARWWARLVVCGSLASCGGAPAVSPISGQSAPVAALPQHLTVGRASLVSAGDPHVRIAAWQANGAGTWLLFDQHGLVATTTVVAMQRREDCDHCPPYIGQGSPLPPRVVSRVARNQLIAIGPLAPTAAARDWARATMVTTPGRWWDQTRVRQWLPIGSWDLDGDGNVDVAWFGQGPQVRHQVRVRSANGWQVSSEWAEPYVLDVDDIAVP